MNVPSIGAKRLKQEIFQAFSTVAYPGNDNICEGLQQDNDYYNTLAEYTGKHWRDFVPRRRSRSNTMGGGMFLLSAPAWRFFLPAYLCSELKKDVPRFTHLNPYSGTDLEEYKNERFMGLSSRQREVVVAVLEFADARLKAKSLAQPDYEWFYADWRRKYAPMLVYWRTFAQRNAE